MEHIPVLLRPAVDLLKVRPGGVYVDCTLGLGGHSSAILQRLEGRGRLVALDRDPEALKLARSRLAESYSNFTLHRTNFGRLDDVLKAESLTSIDGCLADLGCSSLQLDSPNRGFSFRHRGPLDMRMDQAGETTAAQLINHLSADRLAEIFRKYGQEPQARLIAGAIVGRRQSTPLETTQQLVALVEEIKPRRKRRRHPATLVFQALRIAINNELEELENLLRNALEALKPGGRLVVIAFHSLEDRLTKRSFRLAAGRCLCFKPADLCQCPRRRRVEILTPSPITTSAEEQALNPRCRSARLRAVGKRLRN